MLVQTGKVIISNVLLPECFSSTIVIDDTNPEIRIEIQIAPKGMDQESKLVSLIVFALAAR